MRSWKWCSGFLTLGLLSACFSWDGDDSYRQPSRPSQPPPSSTPLAPSRGPQPDFGETVHREDAPPPISGGTLLVTKDQQHAVAADPDRDRVYVVDLVDKRVSFEVALERHDEPGRVVESDDGHVHVVLRRGGAIATIDPKAGQILARRKVCGAPRGLAVDATRARLLATCEGGEVVAVPLDVRGDASPIARLERDLRDVVVKRGRIFVSRFRAAQVLEIDPAGRLLSRVKPKPVPMRTTFTSSTSASTSPAAAPMVAFRMIATPEDDPDDGPILVHEEGRDALFTNPGSSSAASSGTYGSPPPVTMPDPCGGDSVVVSAISRVGESSYTQLLPVHAVLPVDIAYDGTFFAVIAAGNGHTRSLPGVFVVAPPASEATNGDPLPCGRHILSYSVEGQPVAIAALKDGMFIVQSREPSRLRWFDGRASIPLGAASREDTGHAIFHSNSGIGLACASCHPEGGDDGKVWNLPNGRLRTPSLRGTLAGTAPYHWAGDVEDMTQLAEEVLDQRMNGPVLDDPQVRVLEQWLFSLPRPAPSTRGDAAAIARGKELFERTDVGCALCHGGPMFTNHATIDVGTGGSFQAPSLVGVAARAPFFHNGCASTLDEQFTACNARAHGVPGLGKPAIADLLAYLESL